MPALLVAFILLVATTAPVESWPAERAIVVRGTVKDSTTGKPIDRANVYLPGSALNKPSTQTGADGTYLIRVTVADTASRITVTARSIGFTPVSKTVAVGDTITVDFVLAYASTRLESIVVTGTAEPQVSRKVSFSVAQTSDGSRAANVAAYSRNDVGNTEEYNRLEDNRWVSVASSPLSTFSVDVDRASYTNVRRFINTGTLPPKDAVRIEELVNYFTYAYDEPTGAHPIHIAAGVTVAPWNENHRIVRIGLQTKRIRTQDLPPSNLVFLIDVSGSMTPPNKLPLVKQAFRLLVNELREEDRVAIVVYAGAAGLVLPSTGASHKETILAAIEQLEAGGSTAGGAGIALAYDVAKANFLPNGNNRVILATDGDFNVGVSSTSELERYVEQRRKEGSALTILGFGMGNFKDGRLEKLAAIGNGNYGYVDNLLEAKKVFVQEFGATLLTVAKDVKLQVEFNPATVQAYRLIGYENRLLRNEDFTNDAKDAGDMGAGHSVTALYEIVPVGVKLDVAVGTVGSMRYQERSGLGALSSGTSKPKTQSPELLFVNLRYKPPTDTVSKLMQRAVVDSNLAPCSEFRFQLAVAGYAMLLRDSEFKGKLTFDDVITLAKNATGDDKDRLGFVSMVEATRRIASGVAKRD